MNYLLDNAFSGSFYKPLWHLFPNASSNKIDNQEASDYQQHFLEQKFGCRFYDISSKKGEQTLKEVLQILEEISNLDSKSNSLTNEVKPRTIVRLTYQKLSQTHNQDLIVNILNKRIHMKQIQYSITFVSYIQQQQMKQTNLVQRRYQTQRYAQQGSYFPPIFPNIQKQSLVDNVIESLNISSNRKLLILTGRQIKKQHNFQQRLSIVQTHKNNFKSRMHTLSASNKINLLLNRTPNAKIKKLKTRIADELRKSIFNNQNNDIIKPISSPEETLTCIELDSEKLKRRKIQSLLYRDNRTQRSKQQQQNSTENYCNQKVRQLSTQNMYVQMKKMTKKSKRFPVFRNKKFINENLNAEQVVSRDSFKIDSFQECLSPWKLEQQNQIIQNR